MPVTFAIKLSNLQRLNGQLLLRRSASALHGLEVELAVAFDKEQALRSLVAGRRVPIVAAGLHHVRARTEPHLRFSFGRLDVGTRQEHDLHRVGVGVKGNGEARGELEVRAERAFAMVAPEIRDLDSWSAGRIEVG